jgi:hypothetical protein
LASISSFEINPAIIKCPLSRLLGSPSLIIATN